MEKQNIELLRANGKLRDSTSINAQLNDELNEKTELICQLHSENSQLTVEISKLTSELENSQQNENHIAEQLTTERQNLDAKVETLNKCEALVKVIVAKNEELNFKNNALNNEVSKIKNLIEYLSILKLFFVVIVMFLA